MTVTISREASPRTPRPRKRQQGGVSQRAIAMCFILHQSKSMRRASGSSDACVCFSACQATQTAESEEPPQDRSGAGLSQPMRVSGLGLEFRDSRLQVVAHLRMKPEPSRPAWVACIESAKMLQGALWLSSPEPFIVGSSSLESEGTLFKQCRDMLGSGVPGRGSRAREEEVR